MRWEWILPGEVRVAATVDRLTGVESVFASGLVVSQCARGTRPEGHDIPSNFATVTFDPQQLICVLRVGREEVAPSKWPVRERAPKPPPDVHFVYRGSGLLVGLVVIAAIAGLAAFAFVKRGREGLHVGALSGVYRAENGLFVAHFPSSFTARAATVASGTSGLTLVDEPPARAIVILAMASKIEGAAPDPWLINKRFHAEALSNLPRDGGLYEELARRDDSCLGLPGAATLGRATGPRGERIRIWSCAVTRGDAAYLVMSSSRELDEADRVSRDELRHVIDATELTVLPEVGSR